MEKSKVLIEFLQTYFKNHPSDDVAITNFLNSKKSTNEIWEFQKQ